MSVNHQIFERNLRRQKRHACLSDGKNNNHHKTQVKVSFFLQWPMCFVEEEIIFSSAFVGGVGNCLVESFRFLESPKIRAFTSNLLSDSYLEALWHLIENC
jgi:hypothetical protein